MFQENSLQRTPPPAVAGLLAGLVLELVLEVVVGSKDPALLRLLSLAY